MFAEVCLSERERERDRQVALVEPIFMCSFVVHKTVHEHVYNICLVLCFI